MNIRNKIIKVGEGAYFVQSYSEQTVLPFQSVISTQSVSSSSIEDGILEIKLEQDPNDTEKDFGSILEKDPCTIHT